MIDKILVAVERSSRNKSVFDSAVSLAKTTGATLMLLHILSQSQEGSFMIHPHGYSPIVDDYDYDLYRQKLAEHRQWGINFLEELTRQATETGVNTEYTQLIGNPGQIICELADTWKADLIVVGSRGLKGLKEMFLGSVSNYVTHHAPCSVLIVRTAIDNKSNLDSIVSEEKLTTS